MHSPLLTDTARVVQFPHPGGEHVPTGDQMSWNRGPHRRKFMTSHGSLFDRHGETKRECGLTFWGEWEAPSRITHRWSRDGDLPTRLHAPFWERPQPVGFRQNTDPWVFGDTFLYSNCKQLTPKKAPSALQQLPIGSVILFGSARHDSFRIDTVFVVGEILGAYSPRDVDMSAIPEAFRTCTVESLATDPRTGDVNFTLYRGATPLKPLNGMFSFVPCLPADHDGPRFPRPTIKLPGIVNAKSRQSPSGAKDIRPISEVERAWSAVVDQVLECGLQLGAMLDVPDLAE